MSLLNRMMSVFCTLLAMSFGAAESRAQLGSQLVSDTAVRQGGLERMWSTSLRVDPARGRVQSVRFHANLVFAQTSLGVVQAIDAETGRTYWTTEVGSSNLETTPPSINNEFVAVTNGSTLYVLARATGAILYQQRLGGAPSAGPGVSEIDAVVPLSNGIVEAYKLKRERLLDHVPLRFSGTGSATTEPLIIKDRALWSTEQGYIYSREISKTMSQLRFRLDDHVDASPAYLSPFIYAASRSGRLYCISEQTGLAIWDFPTEKPISEPIITLEGRLFVITEAAEMYRIDPRVGTQVWYSPGVARFLSASNDRLYALDPQGRVNVIDANSGSRLAVLQGTGGFNVPTVNTATDRIYLCDSNGLLQCLREVRKVPAPIYHQRGFAIAPPKKPGEAAAPPADGAAPADGATPAPAGNPFGS